LNKEKAVIKEQPKSKKLELYSTILSSWDRALKIFGLSMNNSNMAIAKNRVSKMLNRSKEIPFSLWIANLGFLFPIRLQINPAMEIKMIKLRIM
jgi:hypothetical protein